MIIAGKCPPDKEELRAARERGFGKVELYLEKNHLDNLDSTVKAVQSSEIEVVSVHTPHVTLEEREYFLKADQLASRLDAFLVFHTQYMHQVHIPMLEELDLKSDYGYENQPGASKRILEATVLEKDHNLVLDTAHFFMAEEYYLEKIEEILDNFQDQIPLIHLCDSTRTEDGLGFGKGDIEMEKLCKIIDRNFDSILVLEVMPEEQEEALSKWMKYTRS